jgi:GxxExxY protein
VLRIESRLDAETETWVTRTIGCCISVHRALGPGLLEKIYVDALRIELAADGISCELEKSFPIHYRGQLCRQRVDVIVEDRILLEIKAVDRLASIHHAQAMSYLRLTGLSIALLVNFNVTVLPDGLRRIVL